MTDRVHQASRAAVLALAIPPAAMLVAVLTFSAFDSQGRTPFSPGPPRNIAEAAGMGSGAEVLRLLRAGEDPAAMYPLRPVVLSYQVLHATAFEAAVWSRQGAVVALLDREGVIRDPATRQYLACLAADLRQQEVAQSLGAPAPEVCAREDARGRVLARTRRLGLPVQQGAS